MSACAGDEELRACSGAGICFSSNLLHLHCLRTRCSHGSMAQSLQGERAVGFGSSSSSTGPCAGCYGGACGAEPCVGRSTLRPLTLPFTRSCMCTVMMTVRCAPRMHQALPHWGTPGVHSHQNCFPTPFHTPCHNTSYARISDDSVLASAGHSFVADRSARMMRPRTPGEEVGQALKLVTPQVRALGGWGWHLDSCLQGEGGSLCWRGCDNSIPFDQSKVGSPPSPAHKCIHMGTNQHKQQNALVLKAALLGALESIVKH